VKRGFLSLSDRLDARFCMRILETLIFSDCLETLIHGPTASPSASSSPRTEEGLPSGVQPLVVLGHLSVVGDPREGRSTTQRRGNTRKPFGAINLCGSTFLPSSSQPSPVRAWVACAPGTRSTVGPASVVRPHVGSVLPNTNTREPCTGEVRGTPLPELLGKASGLDR